MHYHRCWSRAILQRSMFWHCLRATENPRLLHCTMLSQEFYSKLKRRKAPIKAVLLDQSFAAGVGNWVADEVLYQVCCAIAQQLAQFPQQFTELCKFSPFVAVFHPEFAENHARSSLNVRFKVKNRHQSLGQSDGLHVIRAVRELSLKNRAKPAFLVFSFGDVMDVHKSLTDFPFVILVCKANFHCGCAAQVKDLDTMNGTEWNAHLHRLLCLFICHLRLL